MKKTCCQTKFFFVHLVSSTMVMLEKIKMKTFSCSAKLPMKSLCWLCIYWFYEISFFFSLHYFYDDDTKLTTIICPTVILACFKDIFFFSAKKNCLLKSLIDRFSCCLLSYYYCYICFQKWKELISVQREREKEREMENENFQF